MLPNAYKSVFDTNISENKDGKKTEGSYLSCVTNREFYFLYQNCGDDSTLNSLTLVKNLELSTSLSDYHSDSYSIS